MISTIKEEEKKEKRFKLTIGSVDGPIL